MDLVVYTQYYRCKTADRQLEIDECLRRNLNHPGIRKLVLFNESDAPPLPQATVEVEVVETNTRITYAEWLRWVKWQGGGIGLLLNADIYLDEGLEHLAATFDSPEAFLALTRYNPGHAGFHLNDYPHWTQDVWGVRADAELPESLLHASSFPLGFPGCDNRIAYVMWSHGFRVRNPCYHVRSVHLQASRARAYDKTSDRLYGGVSYVHPSLSPSEDAELEFTLWTRSEQRPAGVLVNQQAIEQGVHQLRHSEAEVAQRFLDQQQFTGLAWVHEAVGSAHLEGDLHPFASEDTVFLPMPALLGDGVSLQLRRPTRLEGLSLRLPLRSPAGYQLELQAEGDGEVRLVIVGDAAIALKPGGERLFWQPGEFKTYSWSRLRLKLVGAAVDPVWRWEEGAELALFSEKPPAEEPAKLVTPVLHKEQEEAPGANTATPVQRENAFTILHREDMQTENLISIKHFGSRFEVLSDGESLYFADRFWPTVGRVSFQGTAKDALALGEEALFAMGYLQPLQEWKPDQIASWKTHKDQQLFWQYPCRTEEDAYRVHRGLEGPHLDGDAYKVYVGLPWATFIDRGVNQELSGSPYPEGLLLAHRKRSEALVSVLRHWGRTLEVHSVCQHIFWRQAASWIRSAGITDLWISHKEKGFDEEQGLRLHSWSLYAVNDRDPARREGLAYIPIEQRPVFASFSGAHMKHYISDVRLRMAALAELDGYRVTITDMWHFNEVVYDFQVFGDEEKKDGIGTHEVRRYNELLSHTRFSLCPAGAGPNTLRLWESLAVGAIPVVLSDRHQLPDLSQFLPGEALSWDQVVVFHQEADLDRLDERLRAIGAAERHRRQRLCRRVYEATVAMTCFGRSSRQVEPIPLLQELFKPQQVQIPGQVRAEFTGVARQVPASLALISEGPSSIVVHLDQTELLLGLNLKGIGCMLDQLSVTVSRYLEYNKFVELPVEVRPTTADEVSLWLPHGERWWAMGLKLTAQWKQGVQARPAAELQLSVISEKGAFSREARRLDRAGILKAASDRNADRQDDTFDTKHINSGEILERLPAVARSQEVVPGKELFPSVPPAQKNMMGEPLGDGITMYVHLMNRNENVKKNLSNWLQQAFDELVLLDWSSSDPVAELAGVFADPRVRVVRVDGQSKFIRTLAQNLASRMARNRRIFKCDSDVIFKGDFFAAHPLEPGEFWVGDWHHARDENEKHLHGETYYHIDDFQRVNGYDERIISYGQDDTNLKDRMVMSGLTKMVFNFDLMNHQAHSDLSRTSNQAITHPMVRTYVHRMFTTHEKIYSPFFASRSYEARRISPAYIHVSSEDIAASIPDTGSAYEDKALDAVASWYTKHDLDTLTRQQKLDLIWDHSHSGNASGNTTLMREPLDHSQSSLNQVSSSQKREIHIGTDGHGLASTFSTPQRILILGSSVSIQKEGYLPDLMKRLDNLCSQGHQYLNASLGGTPSEATYCYAMHNLVYDIKSFKPTICFLEKTPNDKIFGFSNLSSAQQAASLERTEKYLLSLVNYLLTIDCTTIILTMYHKPDSDIDWTDGSRLDYLSVLYDKVASKTGSLHINVAKTLIKRHSSKDLSSLLLDNVHLNEKGASAAASIIFDQLSKPSPVLTTIASIPATSSDLGRQAHMLPLVRLSTLLRGKQSEFKNSLLRVNFDTFNLGDSTRIDTTKGFLVGFFYLNDPSSGWISITTDTGQNIEMRLFDHYSFMPRLHYRSLPELRYNQSIVIEVIDKPIDHSIAVENYYSSKTFDPSSDWAKIRFLQPVLDAKNNPTSTSFKPVLVIGGHD